MQLCESSVNIMLIIIVQVLLVNIFITQIKTNDILNGTRPIMSDFYETLKSPFFVDKSLLIKQVFIEISSANLSISGSPVVLRVLTDPRFGKTVNHNMLKRFLEINVDGRGESVLYNTTNNYRFFKENELEITKHNVFSKHFGRHPVVDISYKPLSEATDFDHMIDKFRDILLKTFLQHQYLLGVERLWHFNFNNTQFKMYLDPDKRSQLHQYYVFCGFSILCKVLKTHFEKPVFVLIDDFNAIEKSPAFINGVDKRRITNFIKEVNNDLLSSNSDVEAALLAGTLIPETAKINSNLQLWRYYGLSIPELEELLWRFSKDPGKVKASAQDIIKRYSVKKENHQPCSVWTVMEYFSIENKSC